MITKPKTQIEALKIAFANGENLSSLNSFKTVGSLRLPARCFDLEKEGWVFKKERKNTQTRYGTHCSYLEYSLDITKTPSKLWMKYRQK